MICVWYWFHGKWRIAKADRPLDELRDLIMRAGYPARIGTTDCTPLSFPEGEELLCS